jgi:cell division protein FtsW (lipid II flippase)
MLPTGVTAATRSLAHQLPPKRLVARERTLLALAALFVALNRLGLLLARGEPWLALWPVGMWLLCAAAAHLALNRLLPLRDPFILPVVMLLAGWGLTLVARLAPPFAARQVVWLVVSSAAGILTTILPPNLRILRRYRYSWLLLGLLLLGATLLFGVNPSGEVYAPRLWLGFGAVFFQPSEILKILLIVFLASYLAEKREIIITTHHQLGRWRLPPLSYIAPMLLMWGFCMVLLIWQRDLGAASLFFLIFLGMLYASTGQISYMIIGLVLLGLAGIAGYALFDVVQLRVDAWWNPWPEADGRAFQIVQSLLAVAAGGIFGEGVGLGAPNFIPVVHSDFVFAAIAEEWGIIGGLGVLLCLATLVLRATRTAVKNTERPFHSLLAAGIGLSLGVQSLLIMAGVLKLVPLTGVTLPFVSYGGSSLLSSFVMIGLLLRASDPRSHFTLKVLSPGKRSGTLVRDAPS